MCEGLYITAHDLREIQLHLTLVVFHSSIVLLHSSFFLPLSVPGRVAALTHVFFSVSGARILCLLLSLPQCSPRCPPHHQLQYSARTGEMLSIIHEVKERLAATDITHQGKEEAWKEITDAVNAISIVPRTPNEVRRKYDDTRTQFKAKYAKYVRHMGGTGKSR